MSASICLRNGLMIVSSVTVGNIPGKSVTQATSTTAVTTQQRVRSLTTMLEKQQAPRADQPPRKRFSSTKNREPKRRKRRRQSPEYQTPDAGKLSKNQCPR